MTETIIALDFETREEVGQFLAQFPKEEQLYVKVGMELFYQEGADVVRWLKSLGHRIFLDLKLHDIPNTVERSMRQIAKLEIDLTNVHAAGGIKMMEAAKNGLDIGNHRTQLIAVTQLTSTSERQMQKEQLVLTTLQDSVTHYAQITEQAGLDGVVCSALESEMIKEHTRPDFLCVTPGIRLDVNQRDDQQRIVTPRDAKQLLSDYIVMGRAITLAEDPVATYHLINQQLEE